MTDEKEISKIKTALWKADTSIVMTVVVFFALGGCFSEDERGIEHAVAGYASQARQS